MRTSAPLCGFAIYLSASLFLGCGPGNDDAAAAADSGAVAAAGDGTAAGAPKAQSRVELRAYEEALLRSANHFTRAGVAVECAAADSKAALAVQALAAGPGAACTLPDPKATRALDDLLRNEHDPGHPQWAGPAAQAYRACHADTIGALERAPELSSVCAPLRPGAGRLPDKPMARLDTLRVLSRAAALEIHDRAVEGRYLEAAHLALRIQALSQALSRGQTNYLDAAIGVAIAEQALDRLRIELGATPKAAAPPLTHDEIDGLVVRVDALAANEIDVADVIRGEHLQMSLTAIWANDQPEHPAIVLARGPDAGPPPEFNDLLPGAVGTGKSGFEDPLGLIWAAHISVTDDLLRLCTEVGPAKCRQSSHDWAMQLRADAQAKQAVAGLPSATMLIDMVRTTLAMPIPEIDARGRDLALFRISLEAMRAPGCPDDAALAAPPYDSLRRSHFVLEPIVAKIFGAQIRFAAEVESDDPELAESGWRVHCD